MLNYYHEMNIQDDWVKVVIALKSAKGIEQKLSNTLKLQSALSL